LAELFFSEPSPDAVSAVFRALSEDTLFFKRKGSQFLAKSENQVSSERNRRTREREKEAQREQLTRTITELVRNSNPTTGADVDSVLDRLQAWMRHKTGDEVGVILEELVGPNKAKDAAYDLLVRAGRINPARDRFLVIAGIEEQF